MKISETTYNKMPKNLRDLFIKMPNPEKDEVEECFPQTGSGNNGKPFSYQGVEYNNKDTSLFNGDKPEAPSNYNDSGSASRFFYCSKAAKKDRTENGRVENKHPTVKPNDLMKYLCRLITPKGGVVLDPFMGSGSTGKAALQEGFYFIGIDYDEESYNVAKERLECNIEDEDEDEIDEDNSNEKSNSDNYYNEKENPNINPILKEDDD